MKTIKAETEIERKGKLADGFPLSGRLQGSCAKERPERFTDTELQAAVNLVLLSESSSASSMGKEYRQHHREEATRRRASHPCSSDGSSSLASVNTMHPGACGDAVDDEVGESGGAGSDSDPMIDEDTTGPWARVRRYRSLRGLYLITPRMDSSRRMQEEGQKRKAVPKATLQALQLPTAAERTKRKSSRV